MNNIRQYINVVNNIIQLDESFKDAKVKFISSASATEVDEYLDKFKDLSKRNVIKGNDKDISHWIKKDWSKFKKFVDEHSIITTKRQQTIKQKKDSIVAYKDENTLIVIPLTKEASIYYGKNTKWCTASVVSNNYFEQIFLEQNITLYYIIKKDTKIAVSIHPTGMYEIFDIDDADLTSDTMKRISGVSIEFIEELHKTYSGKIENIRITQLSTKYNTEEKQLAAVKHDGTAILSIINAGIKPSEDVQLAAVKDNAYTIRYILDAGIRPSEKVQITAVKISAYVVAYIIEAGITPSEAVKKAAGII